MSPSTSFEFQSLTLLLLLLHCVISQTPFPLYPLERSSFSKSHISNPGSLHAPLLDNYGFQWNCFTFKSTHCVPYTVSHISSPRISNHPPEEEHILFSPKRILNFPKYELSSLKWTNDWKWKKNMVHDSTTKEKFEIQETSHYGNESYPAYTVYGEPCEDECLPRSQNYSWCTKVHRSSNGPSQVFGYCTSRSNITHEGQLCTTTCARRGYPFYWCRLQNNFWGFCTPVHLLRKAWAFNVKTTYTVYGEKCANSCEKRGYTYDWCRKEMSSNVGTWLTADLCSRSSENTTSGQRCTDECDRRGYSYYWCHTSSQGHWDYCSPSSYKHSYDLIKAYTVYGEPCNDDCSLKKGYSYFWCNKLIHSNRGTWMNTDYCSISSKSTSYNESCVDDCSLRGYSYYWCHTQSHWDYCTPEYLFQLLMDDE